MEPFMEDALPADIVSPVSKLAATLARKSLFSDVFNPADIPYTSGGAMPRHQYFCLKSLTYTMNQMWHPTLMRTHTAVQIINLRSCMHTVHIFLLPQVAILQRVYCAQQKMLRACRCQSPKSPSHQQQQPLRYSVYSELVQHAYLDARSSQHVPCISARRCINLWLVTFPCMLQPWLAQSALHRQAREHHLCI